MKYFNTSDRGSLAQLEVHPLASKARVLLASVFGPYACDDDYGSRRINPMELYQNQVMRVQGPFSLRMFHRSNGLVMLQANISAPCTVLDYPLLDRFISELRDNSYDIIGISAIPPNVKKVEKMCSLIRFYQPKATIVVGGHIANMANLNERIDADYVVRGEGISWFRKFLGDDLDKPVNHPCVLSAVKARCLGMNIKVDSRNTAAVLIPSVGCPVGCNFCSTSAMFGGKGHYVNFYQTGDELFDIMCQLENQLHVLSFMVLDENFLLHRKRALRLLELMREHEKSWALYLFSSADALKAYSMEQIVGLGASWAWIGLEGDNSGYGKLKGIDTHELVRALQENGIRVLGATIIGLEEHTPENIDAVIDWAVSHNADFHQFMLYTAVHGSALRYELAEKHILYQDSEIEEADAHGQYRFNYRHPHITDGRETEFLLRAFQRDFELNGPSVLRMTRTLMNGWKKYRNHPEARIRKRFANEIRNIPVLFSGALWAARCWFRGNPLLVKKMTGFLEDIYDEFGMKSRLAALPVGLLVLCCLFRENRRLAKGLTYEPPTFYESSVRSVKPAPRSAG